MVKRKGSYPVMERENMRGGEGVVKIEELLTTAEIYDNGRLYGKITLEPGASIGAHVHEGEMEGFYIICGEAELYDNGEIVRLFPGDTSLNISGEEHALKNVGDTTLEVIALVLNKQNHKGMVL